LSRTPKWDLALQQEVPPGGSPKASGTSMAPPRLDPRCPRHRRLAPPGMSPVTEGRLCAEGRLCTSHTLSTRQCFSCLSFLRQLSIRCTMFSRCLAYCSRVTENRQSQKHVHCALNLITRHAPGFFWRPGPCNFCCGCDSAELDFMFLELRHRVMIVGSEVSCNRT
jgi:hypothetical protein